jgi:tetratricopeptide (TPR) repeat protein
MTGLFSWAVEMSMPGERRREVRKGMTEPQARSLEVVLGWSVPTRREGCGLVMQTLTAWLLAHTPSRTAQSLAHDVLLGPPPTSSDQVRLQAASIRLTGGLAFSDSVPVDTARTLLAAACTYDAEESEAYVYAANVVASVLGRHGLLDEALALQTRLVELATGDLDQSVALTDLGVTHHLLGNLDDAERLYREALTVTTEDNPNYFVLMGNVGEVLLDAGRLDEAADQFRTTIRITHGRATLNAWAIGMLVVTEAERGSVEVARALAGDAEAALEDVVRSDASVSYVLDRLRETLARLPV